MGHPRLSGLTASTVDGRDEPTTVRLSEFGCLGRPRDNSRPPYPGLSRSSTPSRWSAYPPRRRGWQGPLHGQHLHRAAVAQPEYEEVYLHAYVSVAEATAGIGNWFRFFTTRSGSTRVLATAHRSRPRQRNARGYVDDRLRRPATPPRFPSKLEIRGSARLRPHPHTHNSQQKN